MAFSIYFFHGGGALVLYTLAGAAAMLAVCLALVGWYPRLKPLLPALPLAALLLPTRSLNSYFVYAVPGILVAIATTRPALSGPWSGVRRWRWLPRVATLAGGVVAAVALMVAITTPPPIELQPISEHTTGQLQTVDTVTVLARNRSDESVEPHFAVALGAYMSSYWLIHEGPTVLAPHASARYVLWAPNTPSMPGVAQQSVVYALTATPATISSAPLFAAIDEGTQVSPQAINQVVGDPPEITLEVQLVDRLNAPIHRAGVEVALGQILYTQEGLLPGETSINGKPEGQSPIAALTDARGIATFTVRAIQQQAYEVFFQAWLVSPYPHGYSSMVAVHFEVSGARLTGAVRRIQCGSTPPERG